MAEYGSQLARPCCTIGVLMRSLVIAMFFAVAALAAACGKAGPTPDQDTGGPLAEAREMFNAKCVRCHGITGTGNGLFSGSLRPRPHNYTDPAWQASVTDAQIKEMIVRGGVNTGKSPAMPSYPTLRKRPEVLDGLVKIIRDFGKRP